MDRIGICGSVAPGVDTISSVQPVILSGGAGTRLWPVSRRAHPKQFLKLTGERSLLQRTCLRLRDPLFLAPLILANHEHRFVVAEHLREIGVSPAGLVLEPVARNTAPAALVAALMAARGDENQLLLLLPSDHVINDEAAFMNAVKAAIEPARDGNLVTFGVVPDAPQTGYGYVELTGSARARGDLAAGDVARFTEKPDAATARSYLASGRHLWNAGIFLFSARTMVDAFRQHAPETLKACKKSVAGAVRDLDFLRLDEAAYGACADLSLDYAIMEHANNIKCVPLDAGWSDLGSWSSVWQEMDKDAQGNVASGDVVLHDAANCLVYSDAGLVTVVGLEDACVVATRDAVLVAGREQAQDVSGIVADLKRRGREEATIHQRVYRPWGWYEGLSRGDRFQVKCIQVEPGGILSLQSHFHRSEHWVLVSGTARVTLDGEAHLLSENESIYIPLGAKHRLENPGKVPALLIEIQSGRYLGEDDIVRHEDIYNRD